MALPKFFDFFVPVLGVLYTQSPMKAASLRNAMAEAFGLTEDDKAIMLPSGRQPTYVNRINWSIQYLKNAGLISAPSRGEYMITELGKKAYESDHDRIDLHYLEQFDSFKAFHGKTTSVQKTGPLGENPNDLTPVESIEAAYNTIRTELSKSLLQMIMNCSPEFFEHLVVALLLAMGYGYDSSEAGLVIGRSGDGGIDGIINEDKLGFSQVFMQAKRWDTDHTVGRPDVQSFVGALLGKGAQKGLFITTCQFSKSAREYIIDQKAVRVVLVDGAELTRLMIDHGIGVSTQSTFIIKQIDNDYFNDQ